MHFIMFNRGKLIRGTVPTTPPRSMKKENEEKQDENQQQMEPGAVTTMMEKMSGMPGSNGKLSKSRMKAKVDSTSIGPKPKIQKTNSKNQNFGKSSSKFSSIFKLWENKTGFEIRKNADKQTKQGLSRANQSGEFAIHFCGQPTAEQVTKMSRDLNPGSPPKFDESS